MGDRIYDRFFPDSSTLAKDFGMFERFGRIVPEFTETLLLEAHGKACSVRRL